MVKKLNITHEIVIKKTEIIRLENEISERFTRPFSIYTQVGIFALAMAAKLCKGVKQLMFLPVTWLVHVASYEETCL